MELILSLDNNDYSLCTKHTTKITARAIIFVDGKIVLSRSTKYGEYKLPGGGNEKNESIIDTLVRETKEETGYTILKKSIKEWGIVKEDRKSTYDEDERYTVISYCYFANVDKIKGEMCLTNSEKINGYQSCLIDLNDAIMTNELKMKDYKKIPWVRRELEMLRMIKNEMANEL